MSNDERMIRVENACMEQAIRIEALEKRTYNLPKTDAYNRLEQRIEELESKVQWCESEIGAIYSADENWQKTWGQWREKHNELCDVVDAMLTYVRPNMQADYHKAVRLARIDTGDTEAQDEPQDCENEVDAETEGAETPKHSGLPLRADDTGDADVDAIMGELRSDFTGIILGEDENGNNVYLGPNEIQLISAIVRPIVQELFNTKRELNEINNAIARFE